MTLLQFLGIASAAQLRAQQGVVLGLAHGIALLLTVDGFLWVLVLVLVVAVGAADRRGKRLAHEVAQLRGQRDDLQRRVDRLEARVDGMGWARSPEARGDRV